MVVKVVVVMVVCWKLLVVAAVHSSEYRVVYHDLRKMGELTGNQLNFGFGYYSKMSKSSARGTKIDPRMYTVEFQRFDEKNPDRILRTHPSKPCPSELIPPNIDPINTRCIKTDEKDVSFAGKSKGVALKVRNCVKKDLPAGEKCFSRSERKKFFQDNGYIRIFPFYQQYFVGETPLEKLIQ